MDKTAIHRKVEGKTSFEVFDVIRYSTHHPGKSKKIFNILRCPDWVNVLAITDTGQIILVEQFRHALDLKTIELPGGIIDLNQDPLTAAKQELLEEAGYGNGEWGILGKYLANPGLQDNYIYSYFCISPQLICSPEEQENTKVRLVSISEALQNMSAGGELAQAFSMATLYLAISKGIIRP